MKKWLLHIWCIGVLGMLAASCSQIIDDPIADGDCGLETEEVKVTFTIAMGSPESGSRADIGSNDPWGDYDSEVEGNETMGNRYFDNKIEPNKLQVLICQENCTPIVEVEKLLYTQTETNVYTFTGSFVANMSATTQYKIMVFANCPDVDISSTWNDYLPFTMPSGNTEDLTSIPMWGVKTVSGETFTAGTNTNIGTIFVLRAMAKVEIELDEAIASEYSLTGAKFNSYNKYVNCIPKGYNGYTYNNGTEDVVVNVEKTEDLRTISTFNPNSTTSGTELAFMTVIENRRLVAYVPEYDNNGSLKMIVNLKKGTQDGKDYDILFNDLSATTTTPFDIIRNHYYKYTITGVSTDLSANLKVIAQEWTTETESWNYTEVVTVERNMTWTSSTPTDTDENVTVVYEETKNDNDEILTKVPTVYIPWATSTDYATCTFKITAPVGATWIASFEPIEGTVGAFKFLNENNEQVSQMTGKVGTDATLKIVTALSDRTETRKARLHIAVRTWDERIIRVDNLIAEQGITEKEFTLVQPKNN